MFTLKWERLAKPTYTSLRWLETMRPASVASSIITIHQPPLVPQNASSSEMGSESTEIQHTSTEFATMDLIDDIEDTDIFTLSEDDEEEPDEEKKENDRNASFEKLEGGRASHSSSASATPSSSNSRRLSQSRSGINSAHRSRRGRIRMPEAYVELKEEKVRPPSSICVFRLIDIASQAATFHDFLKFVYPQYVKQCWLGVTGHAYIILYYKAWNALSPGESYFTYSTPQKAEDLFRNNVEGL